MNLTVREVAVAPAWMTPVNALLFLGDQSLIVMAASILAYPVNTISNILLSATDISALAAVDNPSL